MRGPFFPQFFFSFWRESRRRNSFLLARPEFFVCLNVPLRSPLSCRPTLLSSAVPPRKEFRLGSGAEREGLGRRGEAGGRNESIGFFAAGAGDDDGEEKKTVSLRKKEKREAAAQTDENLNEKEKT